MVKQIRRLTPCRDTALFRICANEPMGFIEIYEYSSREAPRVLSACLTAPHAVQPACPGKRRFRTNNGDCHAETAFATRCVLVSARGSLDHPSGNTFSRSRRTCPSGLGHGAFPRFLPGRGAGGIR